MMDDDFMDDFDAESILDSAFVMNKDEDQNQEFVVDPEEHMDPLGTARFDETPNLPSLPDLNLPGKISREERNRIANADYENSIGENSIEENGIENLEESRDEDREDSRDEDREEDNRFDKTVQSAYEISPPVLDATTPLDHYLAETSDNAIQPFDADIKQSQPEEQNMEPENQAHTADPTSSGNPEKQTDIAYPTSANFSNFPSNAQRFGDFPPSSATAMTDAFGDFGSTTTTDTAFGDDKAFGDFGNTTTTDTAFGNDKAFGDFSNNTITDTAFGEDRAFGDFSNNTITDTALGDDKAFGDFSNNMEESDGEVISKENDEFAAFSETKPTDIVVAGEAKRDNTAKSETVRAVFDNFGDNGFSDSGGFGAELNVEGNPAEANSGFGDFAEKPQEAAKATQAFGDFSQNSNCGDFSHDMRNTMSKTMSNTNIHTMQNGDFAEKTENADGGFDDSDNLDAFQAFGNDSLDDFFAGGQQEAVVVPEQKQVTDGARQVAQVTEAEMQLESATSKVAESEMQLKSVSKVTEEEMEAKDATTQLQPTAEALQFDDAETEYKKSGLGREDSKTGHVISGEKSGQSIDSSSCDETDNSGRRSPKSPSSPKIPKDSVKEEPAIIEKVSLAEKAHFEAFGTMTESIWNDHSNPIGGEVGDAAINPFDSGPVGTIVVNPVSNPFESGFGNADGNEIDQFGGNKQLCNNFPSTGSEFGDFGNGTGFGNGSVTEENSNTTIFQEDTHIQKKSTQLEIATTSRASNNFPITGGSNNFPITGGSDVPMSSTTTGSSNYYTPQLTPKQLRLYTSFNPFRIKNWVDPFNPEKPNPSEESVIRQILKDLIAETPKFREALTYVRDENGETLLHVVAEFETPSVEALILYLITPGRSQIGIPIDCIDYTNQRTPLIKAVLKGHLQTTKILLDNGANLSKRDGQGYTAPIYCAQNNLRDLLWLMVGREENCIYQRDPIGMNCLHWACQRGNTQLVRLLADFLADFTLVDEDGNTPLLRAILGEELGVAQILITRGLNSVHDKNHAGQDSFAVAQSRGPLVFQQFSGMHSYYAGDEHLYSEVDEDDTRSWAERMLDSHPSMVKSSKVQGAARKKAEKERQIQDSKTDGDSDKDGNVKSRRGLTDGEKLNNSKDGASPVDGKGSKNTGSRGGSSGGTSASSSRLVHPDIENASDGIAEGVVPLSSSSRSLPRRILFKLLCCDLFSELWVAKNRRKIFRARCAEYKTTFREFLVQYGAPFLVFTAIYTSMIIHSILNIVFFGDWFEVGSGWNTNNVTADGIVSISTALDTGGLNVGKPYADVINRDDFLSKYINQSGNLGNTLLGILVWLFPYYNSTARILEVIILILFFLMMRLDPGLIPKAKDGKDALRAHFEALNNPKKTGVGGCAAPQEPPIFRYCDTCRIQKDLRVKHCNTCDRCVRDFDHHCTYLHRPIGRGNHRVFILFITAIMIASYQLSILSFSAGCQTLYGGIYLPLVVGETHHRHSSEEIRNRVVGKYGEIKGKYKEIKKEMKAKIGLPSEEVQPTLDQLTGDAEKSSTDFRKDDHHIVSSVANQNDGGYLEDSAGAEIPQQQLLRQTQTLTSTQDLSNPKKVESTIQDTGGNEEEKMQNNKHNEFKNDASNAQYNQNAQYNTQYDQSAGTYDANAYNNGGNYNSNTYNNGGNYNSNTYNNGGGYDANAYNSGGNYNSNTYNNGGAYDANAYNNGGNYNSNMYSNSGNYNQNWNYGGGEKVFSGLEKRNVGKTEREGIVKSFKGGTHMIDDFKGGNHIINEFKGGKHITGTYPVDVGSPISSSFVETGNGSPSKVGTDAFKAGTMKSVDKNRDIENREIRSFPVQIADENGEVQTEDEIGLPYVEPSSLMETKKIKTKIINFPSIAPPIIGITPSIPSSLLETKNEESDTMSIILSGILSTGLFIFAYLFSLVGNSMRSSLYLQIWLISNNITLHENLNKVRYDHFWVNGSTRTGNREDNGQAFVSSYDVEKGMKEKKIRNPFNKGFRKNWLQFLQGNRETVRATII